MMNARRLLTVLLLAAAAALLIAGCLPLEHSNRSAFTGAGGGAFIPEIVLPQGDIDPNTADADALTALPGIGAKTVAAIIAEREANGAFFYPEDLVAVKGIGEKTMRKIESYLRFPERTD